MHVHYRSLVQYCRRRVAAAVLVGDALRVGDHRLLLKNAASTMDGIDRLNRRHTVEAGQ